MIGPVHVEFDGDVSTVTRDYSVSLSLERNTFRRAVAGQTPLNTAPGS
jgi:hypothetical protein